MFLIDGYNLLHAVAPGGATPEARERLLGEIGAFCRRKGYRALVVFDATGGLRRLEERGELSIRTVAQGRTADEELLALLGSTQDRTAFTLVTNDRGISRAALARGVLVLSCQDFAGMLAARGQDPEKSDSVPPHEVDHWMREFGLEEDSGAPPGEER